MMSKVCADMMWGSAGVEKRAHFTSNLKFA
jgi:hypothetical protein